MTIAPDSLKITIVQGAFLPVPPLLGGAVEKVWYALGRELAQQRHRVVHVSRGYEDLPAREIDHGVQYLRVPGHATPRALWRLKLLDLAYTLRAQRVLPAADILVTNTFWMPATERRTSRGRPYVHVARYPKGQLRLYPQRAILQTVSEPIREAILREVPSAADRTRVIPYPLSSAYLVGQEPAQPVILYTGRLHPEKGVHLLVNAFRHLVNGGLRGWTLRIIGPWQTSQGGGGVEYRNSLVASAKSCGAAVELVEPIFDEGRLVKEYQSAAVFAYPSLAEFGETFGLSVLEAMAAGCAPVVSSLACFRDFLRDGTDGLVFDHRAAEAEANLARCLAELISDAAYRERIRAAAWITARRYTLPEIAQRFIEDFRQVSEHRQLTRSTTPLCQPD